MIAWVARPVAEIVSLPPRPSSVSWSVGLLVGDRDACLQAGHDDTGCVSGSGDGVVELGAVDRDRVDRSVPGDSAEAAGEIDVHVLDVGAGQVVDRDRVGAAERVEVDLLDARACPS